MSFWQDLGVLFTPTEKTKLAGIDTCAKDDQTGAEIKVAYEAEADTNAYNDAAVTKLAGIECSATADQSNAEIVAAVKAVGAIEVDTIGEATGAVGVTVETIELKDGHINELQKLICKDATELTISAGVITVTQSRHIIDTEGDAATDDLVTINGGEEGQILILNTISDGRDVTLKHGTGNILITTGDYTLTTSFSMIMLVHYNGWWNKVL